jgi:hypothetical protein
MVSRYVFYSNQFFKKLKQNNISLTDIGLGSGIVGTVCYIISGKFAEREAKHYVSFFKSQLTPEQKIQIRNSPMKSDELKQQCKEEIKFSWRYD